MIDAVANEVNQRITKPIDDGFIQLGIGTFCCEVDLLSKIGGQVPNKTVEAAEGGADWHHSDIEDDVA